MKRYRFLLLDNVGNCPGKSVYIFLDVSKVFTYKRCMRLGVVPMVVLVPGYYQFIVVVWTAYIVLSLLHMT